MDHHDTTEALRNSLGEVGAEEDSCHHCREEYHGLVEDRHSNSVAVAAAAAVHRNTHLTEAGDHNHKAVGRVFAAGSYDLRSC